MSLLRYSLLRLLVFLVAAGLLWLVGLRDVWLILVAILVSGIASIWLLSKSRDQVSRSLANRMSLIKQRTSSEDKWDEEQRGQGSPDRPEARDRDV